MEPNAPSSVNADPLPETKHALSSKTILGILIAVLPAILHRLGIQLTDADTQALAGDILTILGGMLAAYGRITARQALRFSVGAALFLFAFALVGCAGTELNSRTGKRLFKTQANADSVSYGYDGGGEHISLRIVKLNHSDATLAGGQSFKLGADSVGTTVVSGILSGGLPWSKATAAGAQLIPQILAPAAPVVLQSKH